MTSRELTVGLPTQKLVDAVGDMPGVNLVLWNFDSPPPVKHFDIVVSPDPKGPNVLNLLEGVSVGLVQGQWIGYEGVTKYLPPGIPYANASSVHEGPTAELCLGLILTLQRGIADFVRASERHEWAPKWYSSLADRRVLIVGYGGLGRAIEEKLLPFEVEITRVASTARVEEGPAGHPVQVHGLADLHALVPHAEIVILSTPLSKSTYHLVNAEFLAAMPDDAMLVNMARGRVVDTDALVAETVSGRLRAAVDVTDPEPLPAEHPLWGLPNVVISPHLGGSSSAMFPRMRKLIRQQIERMQAGEPPLNVVVSGDVTSAG
jgi:phosphoglycerate dehydrogenase-like enzyme